MSKMGFCDFTTFRKRGDVKTSKLVIALETNIKISQKIHTKKVYKKQLGKIYNKRNMARL